MKRKCSTSNGIGQRRQQRPDKTSETAEVHKSPETVVTVTKKDGGDLASSAELASEVASSDTRDYQKELIDIHLGALRSLHARLPVGDTFHEFMPKTKLADQRPFMVPVASGEPWAKTLYAEFLLNTRTRRKHAPKAVELLTEAAQQGYAPAQFRLAACCASGTAVEQDYNAAAQWLEKAATLGLADAQFWFAWCFENGKGVRQDVEKAAEWYRKAAEGMSVDASAALAWMGVGQQDA